MHVSYWCTISQRDINKQCFHAVFLIIIFKDEQWRNGLPPGINTFNYIQQMVAGRESCESMWYGCLVETGALMHKPNENLMVRETRKAREAAESRKYRW